ncbi:Scr1 family TA system antitoxin-like transcriptional regulator [Streptomyces sp. NPDC052396]|uniref:helix-turn-helix domain-containing protein n=1 Tax=Streptomyces sp. NPDC052396 TaxID=3365689 RepID=UPI0037D55748
MSSTSARVKSRRTTLPPVRRRGYVNGVSSTVWDSGHCPTPQLSWAAPGEEAGAAFGQWSNWFPSLAGSPKLTTDRRCDDLDRPAGTATMADPERLDPSQHIVARYGARLREQRLRKGWSRAQLGKAVAMSYSAIAKFEAGERVPTQDIAEGLDRALDAKGSLFEAWDSINDSPDARWARRMKRLEASAGAIRHLTNGIPAFLQTEHYARAVLARGIEIYGGNLEEKVQYRMRMKSILFGLNPPEFSTVIGESALCTVVGTAEIMREQLEHLSLASERPHVHLRVVPFDNHVPVSHGQMTILSPKTGKPPTLYTAMFGRGVFNTNSRDVEWHNALYDHVQREALTEEESRAFIRKAIEEKYPCA